MKKRLRFISLILALVMTTLMSGAVLAAKPQLEDFDASGTITGITPGKVIEAGVTGKWVVVERELTGTLSGDIAGDFTMNYKAMIESILTQAGDLHGWLTVGEDSHVLKVKGEIKPLQWLGEPFLSPARLEINGSWMLTQGDHGSGDFSAWVIFIPTPEGHVGFILASEFTLIGEWQP